MGRDDRDAEELSIPQLEQILARRRIEALEQKMSLRNIRGRTQSPIFGPGDQRETGSPRPSGNAQSAPSKRGRKTAAFLAKAAHRVLWFGEAALVIGLIFIVVSGYRSLRSLNLETVRILSIPAGSPTPLIRAIVLPSGHTSPLNPGGPVFNELDVPRHMRPLAQSLAAVPIPTQGPQQANQIFVPAIWDTTVPVIQGDGWEQLKKGVAQHIGSANPGENGNVVLSAHNDIYGELFRDLDKLKPGDEIRLMTASREFLYRVTGTRIVEPDEVSVMDPTPRPTVTLISCYPYLIDTQRIVVFGELADA